MTIETLCIMLFVFGIGWLARQIYEIISGMKYPKLNLQPKKEK